MAEKKKVEPPYSLSEKELVAVAADPQETNHRRLVAAALVGQRRERRTGRRPTSQALSAEFGLSGRSHGFLDKTRTMVGDSQDGVVRVFRDGGGLWHVWNNRAGEDALGAALKRNGRPARNWNNKSNAQRSRELLAERKTSNSYSDLVAAQQRLAQAAVVLESIDIGSYGLSEVGSPGLRKVEDLLDDLISLGEWYDRTLLAVLGWLDGVDLHAKIEKLRNTAGRTPEEAKTAERLADRLERKLEARLEQ